MIYKITFCVRGAISPVLSNLFMHDVFDLWMTRIFPDNPMCRYADDGLVHGKSEKEAVIIKAALAARLKECGLDRMTIEKGDTPILLMTFWATHFVQEDGRMAMVNIL